MWFFGAFHPVCIRNSQQVSERESGAAATEDQRWNQIRIRDALTSLHQLERSVTLIVSDLLLPRHGKEVAGFKFTRVFVDRVFFKEISVKKVIFLFYSETSWIRHRVHVAPHALLSIGSFDHIYVWFFLWMNVFIISPFGVQMKR